MFERMTTAVRIDGRGGVSRRSFVQAFGLGALGVAGMSWRDQLLADAPELRKRGKSVIVLWMQGGPSQFETFDPKSGRGSDDETKSIATAVPGIQIADLWPNVAKRMGDLSIIRSMTNKEGNHPRATYQLHTGYAPSGSLKHPCLGSLMATELAPKDMDLPSFVSVLGPSEGPGFLPVQYAPFRVGDPTKLPVNSEATVPVDRFDRRLRLLSNLERNYADAGAGKQVEDHQGLYGQAARLVKSPRLSAFDVAKESETTRQSYGDTPFGNGCLLARRLVEAGVAYVEVTLNGWDTHDKNRERISALAGQCDPAFAALIADLKQRGRLQDTLVVWMGEFGRTPKINPRGGRDHFPRAFSVVAAGGGLSGGKVIGKTSADGSDVVERPVTVPDLFHTFCKSLGVNPAKENQSPVGRPIKIVDGGKPIRELLQV